MYNFALLEIKKTIARNYTMASNNQSSHMKMDEVGDDSFLNLMTWHIHVSSKVWIL